MKTLKSGPKRQAAPPKGRSDDGKVRQYLYKSPKWRKLRERHLVMFPYCEYCMRERGVQKRSFIVDHIAGHTHPKWRDLFFEPANLQTLCQRHHNEKTKRERPLSGTAYSNKKRMSEFERTRIRELK